MVSVELLFFGTVKRHMKEYEGNHRVHRGKTKSLCSRIEIGSFVKINFK